MPTEQKIAEVERLRELIDGCTIAISTDHTGMSVGSMTALRRALRGKDVRYRVVKNNLAYLAADSAGKPLVKEIVHGPTGIVFGFGDPVEPAKALVNFIRASRAPMKINGGILGDRALNAAEVDNLADLPPREQLIAMLLGRLMAPVTGIVYTLNAPISELATVLQRHVEAESGDADTAGPDAPAEEDGSRDEAS